MEAITPVIRYVESHFEKVQSNASSDPDLLNMLGGDGGSQVDVVLYLIQNSKIHSIQASCSSQLTSMCRTQTGGRKISAAFGTAHQRCAAPSAG